MNRIVPEIVCCENQIHQFFLNQKIGSLLKRSNIDKEKGISPVSVKSVRKLSYFDVSWPRLSVMHKPFAM